MNTRTLQAAIAEAERFLDLARELQAQQRNGNGNVYFTASKATGATRRASMDLTRVLAELRRPM
jgi:hypothetical protein